MAPDPSRAARQGRRGAARLDQTLPSLRDAAGVPIDGFVSTRHDPLDAIEELLHDEPIDELILATTPHHIEGWLHADLPHRAAHLGLPVTAVEGTRALELIDPRAHRRIGPSLGRRMLNKVPEVTLFFWIIKIMCTSVGETAADYLNDNLGLGLTNTTYVGRLRRVAHDDHAALRRDPGRGLRGGGGRSSGRCRSTPSSPPAARRSTGSRSLRLRARDGGRRPVGGEARPRLRRLHRHLRRHHAVVVLAHFGFGLNAVLSFWLAYIMTRPLGASIGDFLSQHSSSTAASASAPRARATCSSAASSRS